MVTYYPVQKSSYKAVWGDCITILKTESFKLSHHFPPDQLRTFIPELTEISSYEEFAREGSSTDYELFV